MYENIFWKWIQFHSGYEYNFKSIYLHIIYIYEYTLVFNYMYDVFFLINNIFNFYNNDTISK